MAVDGLVAQVEQILNRAHALFGDPLSTGGPATGDSGSRLVSAAHALARGSRQMSVLSGQMPTDYGVFAAGAGRALDGLGGTDPSLTAALDEAAGTDRSGCADSGAVVAGAAAESAALEPISGMPAGEQTLLAALRARVCQQRQVVAAYRARDAQLGALLRSLAYPRRHTPGGEMIWGGAGLPEGTSAGAGMFSGLSGLSALPHRQRGRPAALISRGEYRGGRLPGGPGQVAGRAALSKLGRPYVWGAKGPSNFDCSGLTHWAWRQAGMHLGCDTYHQVHDGISVPAGPVRAGDRIFPRDSFDAAGPDTCSWRSRRRRSSMPRSQEM